MEDPVPSPDRDPSYRERYSAAIDLWESGRRPEAVEALEAALELAPDTSQGWLSLGRMFAALSTDAGVAPEAEVDPFLQKAVAALKHAIALDPHCTDAYRALAELYGGRDARLAVAVFEAAAESDPAEYGGELERAQAAAAAATYALARLNVFVLASAHERLQPGIFETEFHFEPCRIASVVIHTCMSGNNRQSAHGWLFESAEPDLGRDRPVAELAISSSGDVSVRPGCPADYDALKERLATEEMTSARIAPPGEAANDPLADEVQRRPNIAGRKRLSAFVAAAALLLILGGTLIYLDHNRPQDRAQDRTAAATAVSRVAEATTPAEAPTANLSPPVDAPSTSSPAAAKARAAGSPAALPRASAAAKEPARSAPRSASQATTKRRAPSIAKGPVTPPKSGASPPSASTPPATAHGASAASPIVVEEPSRISRERVAVNMSPTQRFQKELQETCTQTSLVPRALCKERLRWSHCHPDKWDRVPECRVARSEFAP